jgi:filamentous hemagglutinin
VANGVRLRAQLAGEEISGGHAFQKHVIDQAEFPGITTRQQFAARIENVVLNGEPRTLANQRSAYGTVVIRNPKAADGGTAFRPTNGCDYFLGLQ